jgi:predicted DNA-binding transcriptional regulator YafY
VRPEGFELQEAWKLIADEVDRKRAPVTATARADSNLLPVLRWTLGTRVRIGPPEDDGRVAVELRGHSLRALAGEIAGYGNGLEIIEPPELRAQLAEIGAELSATYA